MASRKRLRDAWGPVRARSAEVSAAITADPEPARRARAPKDTRAECKGKPGAWHEPEITLAPPVFGVGDCRWVPARYDRKARAWTTVAWRCWHQEQCSRCGKILRGTRMIPVGQCPAYPGSSEQRAEAAADAARMTEARAARESHRVPIAGKQGYRRKRPQRTSYTADGANHPLTR